ncbi:MFS transporter [Aquimarina mytili]|uniref:MFS transporter n=2 Tax=Aquimarina mytili TaxID=874423 RepID=A0A937DA70_9FLAO|nr:MFS transporter [Aquimarina mytili]
MTLVAVVSDYLLHPFYPQFFEARFGVTDPEWVGYYFAAICFMVMIAFPFWACVSKKVAELNILVYTQFIAGLLALYCYWTTSYINFWIVSLIMILFKGSYLLVYPYILRIITKKEHPDTIGLLSVVVHLGGILGAVIGGFTVDLIDASYIFLIMAAGDFIQMGMSAYLLKSKRYDTSRTKETEEKIVTNKKMIPKGFIFKIGITTLLLYASGFIIRPFFSTYWEYITANSSKLISGAVYALPGFVALLVLWWDIKRKGTKSSGIVIPLCIGIIGLLAQGIPIPFLVILGRIVYGWAVFRAIVRFDVLLFESSTPETYAIDYSKVHFFQNLGVLISSFLVGVLVDQYGLVIPFTMACIGFTVTLGLYVLLFKINFKKIIVKTT